MNLHKSWQRVRSVPGLARDLIAIVLLACVGIAATSYVWSNYGWTPPWEDRYEVSAVFDYAGGVRPESRQEVRVAGVTVGKIESVSPVEGGKAEITMSLDPEVKVYQDASAVLRTKTPVNLMYVALDPGSASAGALPDGGTIRIAQTAGRVAPYEVLDELDERTQAAITSLIDNADIALADAGETLPGGLSATRHTLQTLRPVMTELAERREHLSRLVTSLSLVSRAVGGDDERLARLVTSLQTTLAGLAANDGDLGRTLASLPGLSRDLKGAMTSTSALTDELNPTLDAAHGAATDLPDALSRLTDTVDAADDLLSAARPVIRRARPVLADLAPLSGDIDQTLTELTPVAADLPAATSAVVPWLDDLAAFVYQTSSVFSLHDGSGGWGRGNVQVVLPGGTQ